MTKWGYIAGIVLTILFAFSMSIPASRPTREQVMSMTLRNALMRYKKHFGAFPAGDTRAMIRAIHGENPDLVNFIEWGNQNVVSPQGDIFDSWGTPLKFYFSSDEVLFRSAGKNRVFDHNHGKTGDDLFY